MRLWSLSENNDATFTGGKLDCLQELLDDFGTIDWQPAFARAWEETHLSLKILQSRSPANLIQSNGRQSQRLMRTCLPWVRYRPTYRKFKPLKILDPFLRFGDRFDHWVVGTQFDPSRLHHPVWPFPRSRE